MKRLGGAFLIVGAVHALTFFLVTLLPNAAVVALGLLGGNEASVRNYWAAREPLGYVEQLTRLAGGDLGATLDNAPVRGELSAAIAQTLPTVLVAAAIAIALAIVAMNVQEQVRRRIAGIVNAASLMPPFVFCFLIAPLLFATPYAGSEFGARIALLLSVLLPLTVMVATYLIRFYEDARREPFPHKLALNGVSLTSIERLGRLGAFVRLLSIFDRVMVAAMVSVLIAEPLLGVPGMGTLFGRAIRTADPNLTVAMSTAVAFMVVSFGVLGTWLSPAAQSCFLRR